MVALIMAYTFKLSISTVQNFPKHLWMIKILFGNIYNWKIKYSLRCSIIAVIYKYEDLFQ